MGMCQLITYFPYSGSFPRYTAHITDYTSISPNLWDVSWCRDEKAEVKSLVMDNAAIHTCISVIPEPETPSPPLNTYAQGSLDLHLSNLCAWTLGYT